ncbi:MAG: helix-turn-helix domain-containing protein [Clostridium sp.]|nr:helix-turn-helix domain-containing protein [Clostridium sp.]
MIKYYKLFDLMNRRNIKKTDLLNIISSPTLAKLSKGETIKTDIIDKICQFLHCQPGDIMECIEREELPDGTVIETVPQLNKRDYVSFAPKGNNPEEESYNKYRITREYIKKMDEE